MTNLILAASTIIWLATGTGQTVCTFKHDKVHGEYVFKNDTREVHWLSIWNDDKKTIAISIVPNNGGVSFSDDPKTGMPRFKHWSCYRTRDEAIADHNESLLP